MRQTESNRPTVSSTTIGFQWPPQPLLDVNGNWVDWSQTWQPLAWYGAWLSSWNQVFQLEYPKWVAPWFQAAAPWFNPSQPQEWQNLGDDVDSVWPTAMANLLATLWAIPASHDQWAPTAIAPSPTAVMPQVDPAQTAPSVQSTPSTGSTVEQALQAQEQALGQRLASIKPPAANRHRRQPEMQAAQESAHQG